MGALRLRSVSALLVRRNVCVGVWYAHACACVYTRVQCVRQGFRPCLLAQPSIVWFKKDFYPISEQISIPFQIRYLQHLPVSKT